MTTEQLYQLAADITSRRRFLLKLGSGALASAAMFLGLSTEALAYYPYACCRLCLPNGGSGCGGCTWCWTCVDGTHTYQCCECHTNSYPCGTNCDDVTNSWYTQISGCCGPAGAHGTGSM
jgi:hypothetical protein